MTVVDSLVSALRDVSFRGKHRLLSALVRARDEREARIFGWRVRLDLRDHIQRSVWLGTYERELVAGIRRVLRPGDTFLDVGANMGFFTLLAARLVGPAGRVIAVEPSPWAADRLAATLAENGIRHVTLVRAALGERPGSLELHMPRHVGNHTPTMVAAGADTEPLTVPVRTLDALLEELDVPRIDAMKMDVEGFEPAVLRGAPSTLADGRIAELFVELNEHWLRRAGSSSRELYDMLARAGFVDPIGPPVAARPLDNRHFRLAPARVARELSAASAPDRARAPA